MYLHVSISNWLTVVETNRRDWSFDISDGEVKQ